MSLFVKKIFFCILLIGITFYSYATHNRAGEITYEQLSGLTFRITIITYTATGPEECADRPELDIYWGDNTKSTLPRVEEVQMQQYIKRNKYIGIHTFPGPGLYTLVVEDPNRNSGIKNIPNSVYTVFCISTTMYINPEIGINNTPILTRAPLDKAAVGKLFVHNPGAYDPDGDSIAYRLTVCRSDDGLPITGYTFPPASDTLYVDAITGDFIWKNPTTVGVYNVAMIIEEWRNGVKIDEIIRDMQIQVYESTNNPPDFNISDYLCVVAGTNIVDTITATDKENNTIKLSATGSAFLVLNSAHFDTTSINSVAGLRKGIFTWNTNCSNISKYPYSVVFKAEDKNADINLAAIKTKQIKIVGPAIDSIGIMSASNYIRLDWYRNKCLNAAGYNIYRKNSSSIFNPENCETGLPPHLGYTKIAFVQDVNTVFYQDFDVKQGYEYCYRICTVWEQNGEQYEGYTSDEICTVLKRGIPTITNVSVETTDNSNGKIYVAWAKPIVAEIAPDASGPFQYILYRSIGFSGQQFVEIKRFNNINDTTYVDILLNTLTNAYSYKVEFYNNAPGNVFIIGTPDIASSIYINITPKENNVKISFNKNVPWLNDTYVLYKLNDQTQTYDSISYINSETHFTDNEIISEHEYCYKIKSVGGYNVDGIINPIINFSQEKCINYVDTFPPCPPILSVTSICDSAYNAISWTKTDTCSDETLTFFLHYTSSLDGIFSQIFSDTTTHYNHYPEKTLAACYYLTAKDKYGNESLPSNKVCVDNCTTYKLPNVFTPNGDGINDYFMPFKPYYFIEKVDMKIYTRWGQLIFETSDPDIMWDGRYMQNKKPVDDGVYFYVCEVYEQRLTGIEKHNLHGFIHVFNSNGNGNTIKN